MRREYPAARNTKSLVHDPVAEIISRPHAIFPGLVFADNDPFEEDCGDWREYSSWLCVRIEKKKKKTQNGRHTCESRHDDCGD